MDDMVFFGITHGKEVGVVFLRVETVNGGGGGCGGVVGIPGDAFILEFGFRVCIVEDDVFFLFGDGIEVFSVCEREESVDGMGVLRGCAVGIVGNAFIEPFPWRIGFDDMVFFVFTVGIEVGVVFLRVEAVDGGGLLLLLLLFHGKGGGGIGLCLCGECEGAVGVCVADSVCAGGGDVRGDGVWGFGCEVFDCMGDVSLFRV